MVMDDDDGKRNGKRGPPKLEPLFPVGAFTPLSVCPHRRRLPRGSRLVCMVCHKSGVDGHPALQRDPMTDPKREPIAKPIVAPLATHVLNRRQRRLLKFGPPRTPVMEPPCNPLPDMSP